ncbi:MAG: hypothetical protein FWG46_01855 [Treponema sp.]|nr:hypothetical protein [Treponema sp.]
MQTQMPNNSQQDNEPNISVYLAIIPGIFLTVVIISNTDLRWYSFFWLIWIVIFCTAMVFSLVWYLIVSLFRKINSNQNEYNTVQENYQNPQQNISLNQNTMTNQNKKKVPKDTKNY